MNEEKFILDSSFGPEIVYSGKKYINFCGCNYLGLQNHPELILAGQEAYRKYGISTAGVSRYLDVFTHSMLDVERNTAKFFDTESGLYFVSGYMTNMVGVMGLSEKFDVIFIDAVSHYSMKDAALLAEKPIFTFAHLDPQDLEQQIRKHIKPGQKPLVLSDGVYPIFGKIPPLSDYLQVIEPYNGIIFLDEAHSAGCIGPHGRGSADYFNLKSERIYFGGTYSKAFGGHGGFIPCTNEYKGQLLKYSPILKGASTAAIPCEAHTAKAIEYVMEHPELRAKLKENVKKVKDGVRGLGFDVDDTEVPNVSFSLGSLEKNIKVQNAMLDKGFFIFISHYIGAPPGGVLRHAIMATHTREHIDNLLDNYRKLI